MIYDIVKNVEEHKAWIAELKKKASYYPDVYKEDGITNYVVTTLVKFHENGVWYARHHVETSVRPPDATLNRWEEIKRFTDERLLTSIANTLSQRVKPFFLDDVIGFDAYQKREGYGFIVRYFPEGIFLLDETGRRVGRIASTDLWVRNGELYKIEDWQWSGACGESDIQLKCPHCKKFSDHG